MKRTLFFVIVFILGFTITAALSSPLSRFGDVKLYTSNDEYRYSTSYIYPVNSYARVDYLGTVADLESDLSSFCDKIIATQRIDDLIIYYAHSPRVKDFGLSHNVMACYSSGVITIATPVILGSY